MKDLNRERMGLVWGAGFLSILGFFAVMFMTGAHGLGLTTDSVVYLEGARHLAFGNGISIFSKSGALIPMTQYGPAYPILLASGPFLGLDVMDWGRLCNAFLFATNIFLITLCAFYTTRERRFAFLAGVLSLVSVHMVELHGRLLSEPLFLSFMFGSILSFMFFLEKGTWRSLIMAGVLTGLALLRPAE